MINDPTSKDSFVFRRAAVTALFLGGILGASAALAAGGSDAASPAGDKTPPKSKAELKTCDMGMV